MRQSTVMPVLLAATLFSQCYTAAAAVPLGKGDDDGGVGESSLEQDALSSLLLSEDAAERVMAGDAPPSAAVGRPGGPRVIVMMADAAVLRGLRALDRGPALYKLPRAGDSGLTLERRERLPGPEPGMALRKRDTMRCMVGRVYRPCWEA